MSAPAGLSLGSDGLLRAERGPASIVVDPTDGGRLTSLVLGGDEVLGRSTPPPGRPPEIFHGSFVMAPFVGRTAKGEFDYDGRTWSMPRNFGEHAMHGFVFDRPWRIDEEGISIDLDERWPFGGTVSQRFDLAADRLTITAEVRNEQREMPAIIGFHPWFAERLADGRTASFEFEPGTHIVCDDEGIPIGDAPGGGRRPWDDSFTDVVRDPVVAWEDGPRIVLSAEASHWIVCETMPGAFCIEPLTGPVNGLAAGGAAIVGPGRPLTLRFTLTWTLPSEPHRGKAS
ncbi:aldose epimerase family protein [Microbacterium tumbae]